jgi:crotonobetainyl-CoA:carnitine CoA-transferase CaiB-like acyl-CoA transferase
VAVPGGCYLCRDGRFLIIRVLDETQCLAFCRAVGRADWAQDESLALLEERQRRREEIEAATAAWAARLDSHEAERVLLQAGVVAGRVNTVAELMEDPHIQGRENFVPVEDPVLGEVLVPSPVPRLSRTLGRVGRAPLLGEHTAQVLQEVLGYDQAKIAELARAGVVQGPGI